MPCAGGMVSKTTRITRPPDHSLYHTDAPSANHGSRHLKSEQGDGAGTGTVTGSVPRGPFRMGFNVSKTSGIAFDHVETTRLSSNPPFSLSRGP